MRLEIVSEQEFQASLKSSVKDASKRETLAKWFVKAKAPLVRLPDQRTNLRIQCDVLKDNGCEGMIPFIMARALNESGLASPGALFGDFGTPLARRKGSTVYAVRIANLKVKGVEIFKEIGAVGVWPAEAYISIGITHKQLCAGWLNSFPEAHPLVVLDPELDALLTVRAIDKAIRSGKDPTVMGLLADFWCKGTSYNHPAGTVIRTGVTIEDVRKRFAERVSQVASKSTGDAVVDGYLRKALTSRLQETVDSLADPPGNIPGVEFPAAFSCQNRDFVADPDGVGLPADDGEDDEESRETHDPAAPIPATKYLGIKKPNPDRVTASPVRVYLDPDNNK